MNKKIFLITFLFFYVFIFSDELILNFKNDINELSNLNNLVKTKEKQLNNLKLKTKKTVWNFMDRNNNEIIIQNKNQLIKELNILYQQIQNIKNKLLTNRESFLINLENKITDPEYFKILDYIDNLYYEYLLKVLNENQIVTDRELLEKRNLLIKNTLLKTKKFINHLNLKLKLIEKHNINFDKRLIIEQINNLNKFLKQ